MRVSCPVTDSLLHNPQRNTGFSQRFCVYRPAEEPTTWGGYLGKVLMASTTYLPSQVTEMFTQGRAFATVRLPFCGHKNICALAVWVHIQTQKHTHAVLDENMCLWCWTVWNCLYKSWHTRKKVKVKSELIWMTQCRLLSGSDFHTQTGHANLSSAFQSILVLSTPWTGTCSCSEWSWIKTKDS